MLKKRPTRMTGTHFLKEGREVEMDETHQTGVAVGVLFMGLFVHTWAMPINE